MSEAFPIFQELYEEALEEEREMLEEMMEEEGGFEMGGGGMGFLGMIIGAIVIGVVRGLIDAFKEMVSYDDKSSRSGGSGYLGYDIEIT